MGRFWLKTPALHLIPAEPLLDRQNGLGQSVGSLVEEKLVTAIGAAQSFGVKAGIGQPITV